ncbi:MAG: hypothetical protein HRK26_04375 [Rickettsiaceae bacterium H1]|nr:hypothetical protein [Rickettsiaceae bacterium H1]
MGIVESILLSTLFTVATCLRNNKIDDDYLKAKWKNSEKVVLEIICNSR